MKIKSSQAFTLVEVLVSTVVIGVMATAGILSGSILFRANESAHQKNTSVNLLQKSQEEVRRVAQTLSVYETLESCQFPDPNNPGPVNDCGLQDISEEFPGFTRTLTVTPVEGQAGLKRVHIAIGFDEFGLPRQMESVALLSRPADPFPGNIAGRVTSTTDPDTALGGVSITVAHTTSTFQRTVVSAANFDAADQNYNFIDISNGQFILPAGISRITATKNGFFDFPPGGETVEINVSSGAQTNFDFEMTPKPENAVVNARVVDILTNTLVGQFGNGTSIALFKNSGQVQRIPNQRTASFTIPFNDTDEQCFTLNTDSSFRAGFATTPSCQFTFNRNGWSTAQNISDSTTNCANPYNGNSGADFICVDPGENQTVDLKVQAVPEVLITGRVMVDNPGNTPDSPVANARVQARWPQNAGSPSWIKSGVTQQAVTDSNGRFVFSVPAVQAMFAANPASNFLQVFAQGSVTITGCCNLQQTISRTSPTRFVGPLNIGDPARDIGDLMLAAGDQVCGNVQGNVKNDFSSSHVPTAIVTISLSTTTDGAGFYSISCPPAQTGFRIPAGTYISVTEKTGFYRRDSRGTDQYATVGSGGREVAIITNAVGNHNIRLWPIGTGNIEVTVVDQISNAPVEGISVTLRTYFGSNVTLTTNAAGIALFSGIRETWPPPAIPTDGYYNLAPQNHVLQVRPDESVYESQDVNITGFDAGENLSITVPLRRVGGL